MVRSHAGWRSILGLAVLGGVTGCVESRPFPGDELELLLQGALETTRDTGRVEVDPESSLVSIGARSGHAAVAPTGIVEYEMESCGASGCPLRISSLLLELPDFTVTGELVSSGRLAGSDFDAELETADDVYIVDRTSVSVEASGWIDGASRRAEFVADEDLAGTINDDQGLMTLFGTLRVRPSQ